MSNENTTWLNLTGKNAIVTGSSRGLGLAIALELVIHGCNVLLVARGKKGLSSAKELLSRESSSEIHSISLDLSEKEEIDQLHHVTRDIFPKLDIVVINTGGPPNGPALSHSDESWWQAFNTILMPSVRISRMFTPLLQPRGAIIFIAGVGAKEPLPHSILSNSMHASVLTLSKILSKEASKYEIRVNTILAGPFDTGRLHRLTQDWASEQGLTFEAALAERYISRVSGCHRLGEASELASVVSFLCSERASFITGASITVDGGFSNTFY